MPSKKTIYLEYKYPEGHWQVYDSTQVESWADQQEQRMHRDHPEADHRRRKA